MNDSQHSTGNMPETLHIYGGRGVAGLFVLPHRSSSNQNMAFSVSSCHCRGGNM